MTQQHKPLTEANFKEEWIPLKNLSVIWADAQRPFNKKRAEEIAANFDPHLLGTLMVTKPNGQGIYHIIDGQTRKAACEIYLKNSDQKVPCHVVEEGDAEKAADMFLRSNTARRPPNQIDHFKVAVVAKRSMEVAINRIVQHHKYKVENNHTQNSIAAVGALIYVFDVCGGKIGLDRTLGTIRAIWGDDANAVASPLLKGFGTFLNEFGGKVDHPKFVEATQKFTPGMLITNAKSWREDHSVSLTAAIAHMLLTNYNKTRGVTPLQRKQPPKDKAA